MLDTVLLLLILFLAAGAFMNSWITKMKIDMLERRIQHRLYSRIKQIHLMNYNMLLKQGCSREDLNQLFPEIAEFDE